MKSLSGYLAVVIAASLWGVAGALSKYFFATADLPPFLLVQVRLGLSALLLLLGLLLARSPLARIQRRDLGFAAIWGVVGMAMVQFTYLFTISETNVATAIFLQSTAPIVTALYAWLFEKQRLGPLLLSVLVVAMTGSVLLITGGTTRLLVSPLGLLSGLSSAVFLAFYSIYGARSAARELSPWTLLSYGLGFGFLFFVLVDLVLGLAGHPLAGTALLASPSMWLFFFYIAIFATVIPFGIYLVGLRTISPTQAAITGMLEPVVGGFTAFLLLGEVLRPIQMLGGVLIIGAVILLQFRSRKA